MRRADIVNVIADIIGVEITKSLGIIKSAVAV